MQTFQAVAVVPHLRGLHPIFFSHHPLLFLAVVVIVVAVVMIARNSRR